MDFFNYVHDINIDEEYFHVFITVKEDSDKLKFKQEERKIFFKKVAGYVLGQQKPKNGLSIIHLFQIGSKFKFYKFLIEKNELNKLMKIFKDMYNIVDEKDRYILNLSLEGVFQNIDTQDKI